MTLMEAYDLAEDVDRIANENTFAGRNDHTKLYKAAAALRVLADHEGAVGGFNEHTCPECKGTGYRACECSDLAKLIVLWQNDQCVKQRRGWHTEKCGINQWCVPQAVEVMRKNFLNGKDRAIAEAACYQEGHDIGLLSKADAWMKQHVEAKGGIMLHQGCFREEPDE